MAGESSSAGLAADASSGSTGMKRENSFGGWLQRVRRTGEYSDLLVRIDNNSAFNLHTLPLKNASAFFREQAQLRPEVANERNQYVVHLELPGGAAAFSLAADFCYLIKPSFTTGNVARIRSVAQQLGIPELMESTKKYLYANVFGHWRSSASFLQGYVRFNDPSVDEYVESRCLKVIASACTKSFSETKHVSVPIPAALPPSGICWATSSSSPCISLTEILSTVAARLPDMYMSQLIDTLLEAEVNLSLKCRQGRNVRGWLRHLLRDECRSDRSRCWVLICLSEMLLRSSSEVPRMELSSQYWCSLLEHIEEQVKRRDRDGKPETGELGSQICDSVLERLRRIQSKLEQRIGSSLHELDDYLHSYRFSASTLLSLVKQFVKNRSYRSNREELEEVAMEVDGCLWVFADTPGSILPEEFVSVFTSFPEECRSSHDPLFSAVDRMVSLSKVGHAKGRFGDEQVQALWGLVDCDKLSPGVHERALNNPSFLCQPHVLERVLRMHSEELAGMGDEEDRRNLRNIMHKVIKASLKLLEENSRRAKEIVVLQEQYGALLGQEVGGGGNKGGGGGRKSLGSVSSCSSSSSTSSSCENSPDVGKKSGLVKCLIHPEVAEEEEFDDEEEFVCKKGEEEEPSGGVEAPQTPMVEARRSLHSLTVGEILSS